MSTRIDIPATKDEIAPQLVPFPGAERPAEPKPVVSRRWPKAAAAAAALLLSTAAFTWWVLGSGPTVRYTTVAVTTGPVTRAVTATGTVNPELTIIVGSYVSGVIRDVTCDYNTRVTRGQSCAKIDPRPFQTSVDQAKANLAVAKAQLEKDKASLNYARLALDRAATLLQTKAVSKDSYDSASSTYDQAVAQISLDQATIQQRQSALDAAQVNLDYTNIVSPVDGTVVSRNVTIGQTVAASFQTPTLFLIATDLTKMQVDANVSESDIGGVTEGNKATFTVDAFPRRTFEGTVSQVRQSPQTVQNVVTYDVVISVNNTDLALKPGLTAATRIVIDERTGVLRVPNQALRYVPGGRAVGAPDRARVWVLRDDQPTRVRVETGIDDDTYTEIVRGDLKADDQVIVSEQGNSSAAPRRSSVPRPRL
jgi:HlyD family secretion protein